MISSVFSVHLEKWNLALDGSPIDTPSSWLIPVRCGAALAVLKVYKPASDERYGADYLRYVGGDGAVRVFEADGGALLMERAVGSRSLFDMAVKGGGIPFSGILGPLVQPLPPPRIARQKPRPPRPPHH